jgi:hypothetical protein
MRVEADGQPEQSRPRTRTMIRYLLPLSRVGLEVARVEDFTVEREMLLL